VEVVDVDADDGEEELEDYTPEPAPARALTHAEAEMHIGTFTRKLFGHRNFYGLVYAYNGAYFDVAYNDGDREEQDLAEVLECRCAADRVKPEDKDSCRSFARKAMGKRQRAGGSSPESVIVID
jgi:hypothetical protein